MKYYSGTEGVQEVSKNNVSLNTEDIAKPIVHQAELSDRCSNTRF